METEITRFVEDRQQRLALFQSVMEGLGLSPIVRLGRREEAGEWEYLKIVEVADWPPFFTDITWEMVNAAGKAAKFRMRYNKNGDGAVVIPVINGKVALVMQYRPILTKTTTELPRGFSIKPDAKLRAHEGRTISMGDLPLGTMQRELGEEVANKMEIISVTHLGSIAQNTGTDQTQPEYYLVQLSVDPKLLESRLRTREGEEQTKLRLYGMKESYELIGTKIADAHSIVGLTLAIKHIQGMPVFS